MKRGIYFVLMGMVGLTALSCNKQLDIDTIQAIPDGKFWANERDLDAAVAGAYALLRSTFVESPMNNNDPNAYQPRFYMYGDRRGLSLSSYTTKDPIRDNTDAALRKNRLRSEWGTTNGWDGILFNWAPFYQVIEQCNIVLENAGRVPENQFITYTRGHYIAEARFVRAFTYFYMVRVWGNVPLVTAPRTTEKLGRTDYNKVLDFVESELKAVEELLPLQYSIASKNAIRATKGMAQATLAHALAWRHKDAEAVQYATKVITSGVYSLIEDRKPTSTSPVYYQYPTIFRGNTSEGIMEIDFNPSTGEVGRNSSLANLMLFGPNLANRNEPLWGINYLKINDSTNAAGSRVFSRITDPKIVYPDSTDDQRFVAFFPKSGSSTKPGEFVYTKYAWVVDPLRFIYHANIVVFRLADIMLLRAECNARLGNFTDARADLNTIRKRVWLGDWTGADADLSLEIFNERRRELLGEGHYYYDLVRTGYITSPDYIKVPTRPDMTTEEFNDGAWTWPVSNRAFTENPNMEQMRYWQRY
ncbi:RagB/SusD family nutrient uptake outer membrane protein [Chitinophaga rhizosphaerae]|uniref:RagB/SusD family nutrient uptake outer membrane protein n=1 Tax=Chitinophaga rhizosphaerae TaxID=1864947 RepID=UPI000F808F7B|nr:RagB/SusD family nutrient uptake outer membrane protein [Chitinophaga rhizosphaerae]